MGNCLTASKRGECDRAVLWRRMLGKVRLETKKDEGKEDGWCRECKERRRSGGYP